MEWDWGCGQVAFASGCNAVPERGSCGGAGVAGWGRRDAGRQGQDSKCFLAVHPFFSVESRHVAVGSEVWRVITSWEGLGWHRGVARTSYRKIIMGKKDSVYSCSRPTYRKCRRWLVGTRHCVRLMLSPCKPEGGGPTIFRGNAGLPDASPEHEAKQIELRIVSG